MTRISNHCLGELFRNMTFLKLNKNEVKMTPDKLTCILDNWRVTMIGPCQDMALIRNES